MTEKSIAGVDLDQIFQELGHFGRYQAVIYSYIFLPIIFSGVYTSQYIFLAAQTPYRCTVPQCESPPLQWEAGSWGSWALPQAGNCQRMMPISSECSADAFHQNLTIRCDSWVYQHNNSIVSEFDLACQDWKRTLVGTIHSAGLFVALPLTGYISDTFGRRTAFLLTAVSPGVVGLIRSFSTNYVMYVCLEFLDAVVGAGVYSTGFILAMEMVGLKRRVLGGNMLSSFFAIGQVLLALLAWCFQEWRTLTRVLYGPSLLFLLYYFVIEESIRWLLSRGRKEEAAKIIYKAAAMNKKKLSPESIKQLSTPNNDEAMKSPKEDTKGPPAMSLVKQIFKSKIIISRLFICSFWWITVTFIYYGLSINSVSLAGNQYVNYILTALVEIPGYCLSVVTLDRFGRKYCIMTAFFTCGVSLVALPFVPNSAQWAIVSLNMLGKLSISMSFSSIYIYTSELFPTTARHSLLGFCSTMGRIGSMVAPLSPLLMNYMASLPYLVFGVMAGVAGMLMLLTPETLRTQLPDTVLQAENIAQERKTIVDADQNLKASRNARLHI